MPSQTLAALLVGGADFRQPRAVERARPVAFSRGARRPAIKILTPHVLHPQRTAIENIAMPHSHLHADINLSFVSFHALEKSWACISALQAATQIPTCRNQCFST